MARRWPLVLAGLLLLTLVAFILSIVFGSVKIPLREVIASLGGGAVEREAWRTIVLQFRLPKAITALLAGAALAVSGLQMQTLFRNPLADPFVLGVSSGASLGVALIVLGGSVVGTSTLLANLTIFGSLGVVGAASAGAALVFGVILLVSRRIQSIVTLLILGLMFGYLTGALVSILMYFSVPEQIQAYINWTYGSFGGITWQQMPIFAGVVLAVLVVAGLSAKPLNALLLGESYARSMGLNVAHARYWIIGSTSLLAGAVTAFCGPIAFLGLAVPHLARNLLNTSEHRILLPAVMLLGALLALIFDLIAQLPGSSYVLPLNAVTALLGAPTVIWVLLSRQRLRASFQS